MNPTFAARFPFEMFHRVRDINLLPIDPRFFERAVHYFSGRADERFADNVFIIAGLLAHKHDRRSLRTFAEDRLRRVLI